MKKRKINKKVFSWQGITYRIFVICVNALFFKIGAKQAMAKYGALGASLIWNTINMGLYFFYHGIFLKLFSLEVKTKGAVVWFTGLPCSGKTTVADAVAIELKKLGKNVERLDGDVVRKGKLSDDLKFSKEDRNKNINRVNFVSKLLSRNETIVLASFVSPYRDIREKIRIEVTNYIEVFVNASSEECAKRDIKGMWAKAKSGEIKGFTGYDAEYQIPFTPEIILDTKQETIAQSTEKVINYLKNRGLI